MCSLPMRLSLCGNVWRTINRARCVGRWNTRGETKQNLTGKEQIERAAQNLAEAEEARRTQEDVLNDLQRECTRLEAEQANLDRQMDQSRTQITELETVIASKQSAVARDLSGCGGLIIGVAGAD